MIALIPTNRRHISVSHKLLTTLNPREVAVFHEIVQADSISRLILKFKNGKNNKLINGTSLILRTLLGIRVVFKILLRKPTDLIFFNDFLICEKIVLKVANKIGIRTILLQDGFFPILNSAGYIGSKLHSSPFGAAQKAIAIVYSEVAAKYLSNLNSTQLIVVTSDDLWESRFHYQSDSRNVLFFASDFLSGAKNLSAHDFQKSMFIHISEYLLTSGSSLSLQYVPHPNEGNFNGQFHGCLAIGFNSYAIEELVYEMPVVRLDLSHETRRFLNEIRDQTAAPILSSFEMLQSILKQESLLFNFESSPHPASSSLNEIKRLFNA